MSVGTVRIYLPQAYCHAPCGWIVGWNKQGLTFVIAAIVQCEVVFPPLRLGFSLI